ncbi:restriction endonuclease [Paraburkholderia elongata]|uniref:restriction endonuclease n=1 Tax=Paraburkholderia elongata TaxID=2675747 RepID=UPI0015574B1D|nr:restriction endonuclease [Paraburkholderia elongata]
MRERIAFASCADHTRSVVHLRLFELTVASVFSDFGYKAAATAYSNDGGIDVVLEDGTGGRIGVQVKRQRRSVEVEQLRAFLGALTLGGFTSGVFVSSSRFCRGAILVAQRSTERIMPIEIVDANRFFDMLGFAQLNHAPGPEDCGITRTDPLKFRCNNYSHLNTL